jgi:exodeoxyribonuclease V gamma subunit
MLALTAAHPDRLFESATVGRGRRQHPVTIARIAAFEGDAETRRQLACGYLEALIDLYDRGMREPLPLYCTTSAAYAEASLAGGDAVAAGRSMWESGWDYDKEDKEPEHLLVLGGVHPFDQLLVAEPGPDEVVDEQAVTDPTRFGLFALRLWGGLLSCEELVQR